ncbi:ethanolamine ammonia-lyase subunit EutB [Vibrio diabolicus]|uniref:ethanolamine ammonia-lyase subunit EutB n=1 Tax=Vibrio diabolicus TaxID=50719 RepID=UPI00375286A9
MTATYRRQQGSKVYTFKSLADLMAKATPERSGDVLAGVCAQSAAERVVAQMALSELPLKTFLNEAVIPYESDDITRLIIDTHDLEAFKPIEHLTVGDFRNWLLSEEADGVTLAKIRQGLTPEMVAAVSKIMRNQDLILVAKKCQVVTAFRNTIGLPSRLSTRLQPNHPTDSLNGIAATIFDGLMYGNGDAVIGINPATDNVPQAIKLMNLMDEVIQHYQIPTQSCVLTHVTNTIEAIEMGAPVDLVFQSIGGTQGTNDTFGIDLSILKEAHEAALSLNRGSVGNNVMYFETGQGTALSANAFHGVDQQTCEARAYAVAKQFDPLLVNTVVGFIGPEYLFDGKQIIRAGLEDHFCGKLLGLPMGCDICYTNHAYADQNDMDNLLTLLGVAECSFIMGIPGSDDIMLNYQTTSFHDALYARKVLGLKPAPEFEQWLMEMQIFESVQDVRLSEQISRSFSGAINQLNKGYSHG